MQIVPLIRSNGWGCYNVLQYSTFVVETGGYSHCDPFTLTAAE